MPSDVGCSWLPHVHHQRYYMSSMCSPQNHVVGIQSSSLSSREVSGESCHQISGKSGPWRRSINLNFLYLLENHDDDDGDYDNIIDLFNWKNKHCKRHNGPKGWLLSPKWLCLGGHIISSYTDFWFKFSFQITIRHQLQILWAEFSLKIRTKIRPQSL